MRSNKKKYRQPSNTLGRSPQRQPKSLPTIFLDYDQGGKVLPDFLRKAGLAVERLQDHFDKKTPDTEWIPHCATNGWLIVTGDKGIEFDPENRAVVVDTKAKILLLDENNSRAAAWAAAIIVGREGIADAWDGGDGPLIVSIKNHGGLVYDKRVPKIDKESISIDRNQSKRGQN